MESEATRLEGSSGHVIRGNDMIPDVLRRIPGARSVFDRYGLRGCGGIHGPVETVAYFARAHGVDLTTFLRELNDATATATPPSVSAAGPVPKPLAIDSIYRRFFLAGIAVTLTAGATWGALLLWRLASAQSFAAVSVAEVNAHGHAQIFGWIGLFVIGFALQAFPRFKHRDLPSPAVAQAIFPIYLAGLIFRTAAEPFAASPTVLGIALAGSCLEIAAVAAFAWTVFEVFLRTRIRLHPGDWSILAATVWFVVQAFGDAGLLILTATASSAEQLVERVSTYQLPLRDVQIHGFGLLMVLGVSQRFLPGMLGIGTCPTARRSLGALTAINAGVVAESLGFLAMRLTGVKAWGLVVWTGVALIAAAALALALPLGVFRATAERDRSIKFVRAAYTWLFVSLGMLLLFPLYLWATGLQFSHAYFGATRHAVTVGFLSLMIVGVASKVVPTLNGVAAVGLPALWGPFSLINCGCALRVVGQTVTDLTATAFPFAGASGFLEVAGLSLWGLHIARLVLRKPASESGAREHMRRAAPGDTVGRVLEAAPETLEVFLTHGFTALQNPFLRRTLAAGITIRQACRLKGVDETAFLDALNAKLDRGPQLQLPILGQPLSPRVPQPRTGTRSVVMQPSFLKGPRLDPDDSVQEIAARFPGAAEVLARHHLDTCCGGAHPLRFAAERHGVPLEPLLEEIARASGATVSSTSTES